LNGDEDDNELEPAILGEEELDEAVGEEAVENDKSESSPCSR
jgi:hypothetical protein